jgi:hypothetical protein
VDGSAASVSYGTGAGTHRIGALQLPWSHSVSAPVPGAVSLVARDRGSGYVACRIYVDGRLEASQESTGPSAVAACSVPPR